MEVAMEIQMEVGPNYRYYNFLLVYYSYDYCYY